MVNDESFKTDKARRGKKTRQKKKGQRKFKNMRGCMRNLVLAFPVRVRMCRFYICAKTSQVLSNISVALMSDFSFLVKLVICIYWAKTSRYPSLFCNHNSIHGDYSTKARFCPTEINPSRAVWSKIKHRHGLDLTFFGFSNRKRFHISKTVAKDKHAFSLYLDYKLRFLRED